uniref:MHD domain-containing protein n=1 Tax=Micromonas pusilla TaxID=38833 RepID=A0A6U0GJU1_MICPS|mmetsp:Transcript_14473/g.52062  ORF Transcript_14473/g.52062 Transcript_14473/m.52062 type:complete len:437 (+) Transcript_14473:179-1489(+)
MTSPAVCSVLHILDGNMKKLLSRDWRGDISPACIDRFVARVQDAESESELKPVMYDSDAEVSYVYITHNNLYLLAITKSNCNAAALLTFLHRLVDIFRHYFKTLEEESIRDNFVIIYELLDEVMDNGYPQFTEAKILSEFITVGAHQLIAPKAPMAVTNAVSWRSEGIRYQKNEVFLDVVESLNIVVNAAGQVVNSETFGALRLRAYLSGMPECKLGLNDKIMLHAQNRSTKGKSVELDDIKFHQCVRLARFENDRTISFIPPDGHFDLMNYRISTANVKPLIWIEASVNRPSRSRVEYVVKVRTHFKSRLQATGVEIKLPVSSDATSPEVNTGLGSVAYVPEQEAMLWKIKSVQGGKEIMMRAKFSLPSVSALEDDGPVQKKPPITCKFEIPYYTVSGVQVRYLKVLERSGYQALPWVRYITKSGNYEFRLDHGY